MNNAMCRGNSTILAAAVLSCMLMLTRPASAQPTTAPTAQATALAEMSLEDLMNVEVTSVSRHRQRLSDAPAAVTVITRDDIARSNLHSIPELLRLAPGLNVAQADANDWAISSRGFNYKYANKLLVLIDGRTIYSPFFAGVTWDEHDYLLQDLDRIEVIRGPGATLWGANAVNGVINITTKRADETQGLLTTGLVSNVDNLAGVRYGGKLGDDSFYRVFGMFRKTEDFVGPTGDDQFDGWQSVRGGFRFDRDTTPQDTITLQGEIYQNHFAQRQTLPVVAPPYGIPTEETHRGAGEHLLGRWTHTVSSESEYGLQVYYDHVYRAQTELGYKQHTWDAEFQHRFPLGDRQSIIWGVGARYQRDDTTSTDQVILDPESEEHYRLSTFIQDEITIVPEHVRIILGSKFEYSSYSDFEYQPSARALWTPNDRNTLWTAVSRAVHTPTRADQDATVLLQAFPGEGGVPTGLVIESNDDQESEELTAFELGYRVRPTEEITVDIAGFYNRYDKIRSNETGAARFEPTPFPRVIVPILTRNGLEADTYGVETSVNVNVTPQWRVGASHTFLQIEAHRDATSTDVAGELNIEGASPQNQLQLHSYYQITRELDLNASAYYVETLPAFDVPSYVRMDVGLTWRPTEQLRLTVGVQNLLDDRHPEFGPDTYGPASEVPRTVYGQLTWAF